MAVANLRGSESHTGAIGSISEASFTWTHGIAGDTPRGVIVFVVGLVTSADDSTAVTYGGASLTAVTGGFAQDTVTEPMSCRAWFLGASVPTGAADIVVTRNNNTNELWAGASTVTAGADTEVNDVQIQQEDGALTELLITDGSPGTNSLRFAGVASGLAAAPVAGANSTLVNTFDTGNQTAAMARETTVGQGARNVGFNNASDDRAAVFFAVREVSGAAATSLAFPPRQRRLMPLLVR